MDTTTNAATETTPNAAQIILAQLGRKAMFMLGAKDIFSTTHEGRQGLCFKVRGSAKGNFIRITVDPAFDLYIVELAKIRGLSVKIVAECEQVHVTALHRTIEQMTGLYTSI